MSERLPPDDVVLTQPKTEDFEHCSSFAVFAAPQPATVHSAVAAYLRAIGWRRGWSWGRVVSVGWVDLFGCVCVRYLWGARLTCGG